ncbi:MAG: carbohydrate ABC transporter permease [Spirochaetaceae bacterium]|nr:MAG: carbohydrate ABC transporter permease [Spirochaetaceae bacterium]
MARSRPPLRRFARMGSRHLVAILASVVFVYPVLWILMAAIKPDVEIYRLPLQLFPSRPDFAGFQMILQRWPLFTFLANSLLYSFGAVLFSLAFALFAAYGLSRNEFAGKQFTLILILVVQMIPALVTVVPIYLLMRMMGLYDSRLGMVVLYSAMRIPWGVWIMVGFLNQIPRALDEAATIDGCSQLGILRRIIFPLALPGLASAAIFTFVGTWNEFAIASIILRSTNNLSLPVATMTMIAADPNDWRLVAATASVNLLPVLAVFALLQRHIVAGLTRGALKG